MTDETTTKTMSETENPEDCAAIDRTPDAGVRVYATDESVDISESSGPADLHYLVVRTETGAKQLARFAAAALKGDSLSVNDIDIDELELEDLAPAFEDGDDNV
ncbi:hypothetical protein C470_03616 [Halorubrum distributum JCM 13561]|uniref:Uncharacterized protein n=1 Tax=Halorubrum distributum JCM 13561 TaxID=1227483 RepID=M0P0X1_9EURY|nr:hypothetical protein [Halorubrum litoreum]EMA63184.1 hypothetical protein C470_03616 [Halorubrum litoreum JCM 13561]